MEIYREMVIGASFQQSPGSVRRRPGVRRILAFAFVFALAGGSAAQQSPAVGSTARPASKAPSPFLEAETLLRQGSIAEAKVKIEEQLKLNPSSVEGYNLLGIAYGSEKDYENALEAFQHALKLAFEHREIPVDDRGCLRTGKCDPRVHTDANTHIRSMHRRLLAEDELPHAVRRLSCLADCGPDGVGLVRGRGGACWSTDRAGGAVARLGVGTSCAGQAEGARVS